MGVLVLAMVACKGPDDGDVVVDLGVGVLGWGAHTTSGVDVAVIGASGDRLNVPRDLAFNPERPDELWTVNRADDSVVIFFGADGDAPTSTKIVDPYAFHFMEEVSSIAMGEPGLMATCQESRNTYNDQGPPNDFMGPALWSTDLDVFGTSNPEAIEFLSNKFGFYTDLGSHLDMLHDTPLCMGIAWEEGNAYWTFDGKSSSISRQDFKVDHGVGYDDHSDGEILRYAEGLVRREADVPSHLVYDQDTDLLYIADTGNGRIAVLDTTTGTMGARLPQVDEFPYPVHNRMDGAVITTLVDSSDGHLFKPSGLALHDGLLYVSDNSTGRISAYTLEGELVDWIESAAQPGGLMGIELGPDGALYWVDAVANRVTRFRAKPAPE